MVNSWSRLEKVIEWSGLSINAFARSIGLRRAENLYQIKKGNNSISKDLAELIAIKYCNISKSWLLTGEGSMLLTSSQNENCNYEKKKIPYYNYDFSQLEFNKERKLPIPEYYIEVPVFSNCDFATICVGDSMTPEIPSGAIIALKEIEMELLLPGEMYYIITDNYSTVKFIRMVENDHSKLRLVPKNKNEYDDAFLSKNSIRRLFLVKGVISPRIL